MNPRHHQPTSRARRLPALLAAAALLAACGAPAETRAEPCAVEERRGAIGGAGYRLADDQAHAHCSDSLVLEHYEETIAWFLEQTEGNRYAPDMIDDLATYYAEPLLHEAREIIYHHQQADRVAVARFDPTLQERRAIMWAPDGRTVDLIFVTPGYELHIYEGGAPNPTVYASRPPIVESWVITMVYAPEDRRWKLIEARVELS